jgi:spore germination protein KC
MKRRMLLFVLLMILSLILSGCWDYIEYEDLAQIVGMGMDYNNESHQITITILYPSIKKGKSGLTASSGATAGPQWIVHSVTDTTLLGAVTKLQEVIPQKMFYGYLKVLVIGEEAAKYNLMEIIDEFNRTPSVHNSVNILISSGKAEDVLKTVDPDHIFSSLELHDLVHLGMNTGAAYVVTLNDFTQMLAIGGWEATAPRVISIAAKPEKEEVKGGTQSKLRFNEERIGTIRVTGMAVFKGKKFAGWLEEKESRGFGWITGKKINPFIVAEIAGEASTEDILYYRVDEANGKIKVQMVNNQPVIDVDVTVNADLRKYYRNKGTEFISAEEISIAQQILSDCIRSDIDAALQKGQKELKSDIFGFGFALFRNDPSLWKNEYEAKWEEVFPNIPVIISVDAKVINTGTTTKRLIIK